MNARYSFQAPEIPEPVSVLIGASGGRAQAWLSVLTADGRFRVSSVAADEEDLKFKLRAGPEALLLEAAILGNEERLMSFLTGVQSAVYVVTPLEAGRGLVEQLKGLDCVKAAFFADLNLPETVGRMYADLTALRQRPGISRPAWGPLSGQNAPAPLRIITVWNQMGGVGKTTIASNLALESARRGYPTLLVGLGAPDDLPLILGLRVEPNITDFLNTPTLESLRQSLQRVDTLNVLAGFPDVLAESRFARDGAELGQHIGRLITTAAHQLGCAVIIVDAPPSALAESAVAAANTLVLVARPSLEGVLRTVDAWRTASERLNVEHRIPPERIFVVLNRMGGRLSADDWQRAATAQAGRPFPPIIAQIPDLPAVGAAQDACRLPLLAVEEFNRSLKPLADTLLAQEAGLRPLQRETGKLFRIGPLKVRF